MTDSTWFVYVVRCADNSLYTGVTNDLQRRVSQHNSGSKGAKYTKTRRPVCLVYFESAVDRSAAQSREYAIKKLSRSEKETLVRSA